MKNNSNGNNSCNKRLRNLWRFWGPPCMKVFLRKWQWRRKGEDRENNCFCFQLHAEQSHLPTQGVASLGQLQWKEILASETENRCGMVLGLGWTSNIRLSWAALLSKLVCLVNTPLKKLYFLLFFRWVMHKACSCAISHLIFLVTCWDRSFADEKTGSGKFGSLPKAS